MGQITGMVHMFCIKFAEAWIQTEGLWCQKRLLYNLSCWVFFFYIVNVAVVVDGVIADAYIVLLLMLM